MLQSREYRCRRYLTACTTAPGATELQRYTELLWWDGQEGYYQLVLAPGHFSDPLLQSGTAPGQGTSLGSCRPGTIDRGKNLVLFRETKLFQLREDQLAVYLHFKGTAAALDEPGSQSVLILDGVLQTCSVWEVVSLRAVFD